MSISDIHVDPDRLRAIAEELSMFSNDIRAELAQLDGELARLGRSWQDDEFKKFKRAIQPLRRVLDEFHQEIARNKPNMLADAEAIRAYRQLETP
ncbi:MAG: WXG100 family type VII secretion target [Vicinamibacterales bacterium]